jgi:hypothetical protein
MTAFLISVVLSAAAILGSWYFDQLFLDCRSPIRLILTLALLGIAIWVISIIHVAFWLRVPGAYGPVQFWAGAPGGGLDFMGVRALALFAMLAGMLLAVAAPIATIASFFAQSATPKWHRCVIPAVAIGVYCIAYWMFFAYQFFPSA